MISNSVPPSRHVAFFSIAAAGLAWDLYSKWWAFTTLGYEGHQSESWFTWLWGEDVFRLRTSFNHGALWGMGQGYSGAFAALSIIAAILVMYWLFVRGAARSWWLTVSLGLIMAGTLGNLYDRLGMHGCLIIDPVTREPVIAYAVRDFLYFEIINWPIFNFADAFLVTGAVMLLIQSFQAEMDVSDSDQPDNSTAKDTGSENPIVESGTSQPVATSDLEMPQPARVSA